MRVSKQLRNELRREDYVYIRYKSVRVSKQVINELRREDHVYDIRECARY